MLLFRGDFLSVLFFTFFTTIATESHREPVRARERATEKARGSQTEPNSKPELSKEGQSEPMSMAERAEDKLKEPMRGIMAHKPRQREEYWLTNRNIYAFGRLVTKRG